MKMNRTLVAVMCSAAALTGLSHCITVVKVCGSSMEPTLSDGEILVCRKRSGIDAGDIAVFSYRNRLIIKRIADISVSGFYLLGDNKDDSTDSRTFGRLPFSSYLGRPILRIYPLNKAGIIKR